MKENGKLTNLQEKEFFTTSYRISWLVVLTLEISMRLINFGQSTKVKICLM